MKHRRNPSTTAIISPATEEGDSSDVMFQVGATGLDTSFSSSSPSPPPPQTSSSLSSGSSETDSSSSPTTNKSKQLKKCQRISRSTLSLTSSIPCSITATQSTANILAGQLQSSQSINSTSNTTLKVLDALAKFQTCLFVLSNTVVRLHESLKLIIPGASLQSSLPTMPGTSAAIRPLSRRNSSAEISLDNNNVFKGIMMSLPEMGINCREGKSETIVSVPPACIDPQASTDTSFDGHGHSHEHACHVTKKQRKLEARQRSPLAQVATKLVKYIGLLLALFASVCMSLVTLVVKFMDGYTPVSKVIWRLQGVLLPSLFIVLYVKYYQKKPLILWGENTAMKNWKWKILVLLVARGLVGSSADIFQYYSLKYLPLADSTVISFSTPIFVCIVAHFVLGEKCGVVPIFTSLLTLCGVIVISKPPILTGEEEMNNTVLLGNILAILCMISATFTTVIMRYLKHVHFAMTMLALGIVGTVEGFVVTAFTSPFEFPQVNGYDIVLAALTSGLFFFGQLAQTLALKHEEAGVVSLVRTCDVLFAFIWQVNLLNQKANIYSYVGAIIVTIGVCITALRKWISDMPDHNPVKNRLFFILR